MKVLNLLDNAKALQQIFTRVSAIEKVDRDSMSGGGLMTTAQANRFIDYIQDANDLLRAVRIEPMESTTEEFPGILFEDRQTRGVGINSTATQGVRDAEDQEAFARGIGTYKFAMTAQELALTYKLSENLLKDNIEGRRFESRVIKGFSQVMGNDLLDLYINGDVVDRNPSSPISVALGADIAAIDTTIEVAATTGANFPLQSIPDTPYFPGYLLLDDGAGNQELCTYLSRSGDIFSDVSRNVASADTGLTFRASAGVYTIAGGATVKWWKHHLLGVTDGWLYKLQNPVGAEPGTNALDGSSINSGVLVEQHFFAALDLMPTKFLDRFGRGPLRWIMNEKTEIRIREMISRRGNGYGLIADNAISGQGWSPLGIPILTATKFPEDQILLTNPKNLAVGIWLEIWFRWTREGKTALMTNQRYYNARTRVDCNVERKDYSVLITDLSTAFPAVP